MYNYMYHSMTILFKTLCACTVYMSDPGYMYMITQDLTQDLLVTSDPIRLSILAFLVLFNFLI